MSKTSFLRITEHRVGIVFFLLFFLIFSIAFSQLSMPLKVGIYQNQPKIFIKEDGKPSGFWVDLINHIASQEGWTIQYVPGSWDQCLSRLEQGEIDIMPDVAFTEKRDEKFLFSEESVYTSWSGIYTEEGEGIESILDLDGKRIAVLKNSVNYEGPEGLKALVETFDINCVFVKKDDYLEVFQAVKSGEAHAGVVSKDFALQHLTSFELVTTPIIFQPSTLYFAFATGSNRSQLLKSQIDEQISQMKAKENSFYFQTLEKWFTTDTEERHIFKWLIWGLVGSGVIILILVGGSLLLRSQVRSRTKALTEEIAERKKAEEELQQHEKHLEDMVNKRTAELTRSNKELEMFAYITSHDLQEPLRMVTSYLQLIEKRYTKNLDDDGREFITFAVEGAKRMQTLINDLLKYSRVDTKGKAFSPVDCNKVLSDTLTNLEIAIEESEAKITHDHLPTVSGDKTQLRQLFQNLIGNAIKFRGETPPEIHIGVESLDNHWEFTIKDNGIGIEPKYFERIFQVFQRLHGRNEYSGNGIGLAICKKIVQRHGGKISVSSNPGEGTIFSFTITKEGESYD